MVALGKRQALGIIYCNGKVCGTSTRVAKYIYLIYNYYLLLATTCTVTSTSN